MKNKGLFRVVQVLALFAWTTAQAYNPYQELNLDPQSLSDRGIRITFHPMRGTVRFLVVATATVNPRNIEPGIHGITLEYGAPKRGDPDAPRPVTTRWQYVNGSCVAFFTVSEDSLPHGTLKLHTTTGAFAIGLQSIVRDRRHMAQDGTILEKTIDQVFRVK